MVNVARGHCSRWDRVLYQFAKEMYRRGTARGLVVHAVLGTARRRRLRRWHLQDTWAYLWAWKRSTLTRNRPPLPVLVWQAVVATAFALASQSRGSEQQKRIAAALIFWSGFRGLLRPGEMWRLSRETIVTAADFGEEANGWLVFIIDNPKSRRAFGFRQFVLVSDPVLAKWMSAFLNGRLPGTRLFEGSQQALGEFLKTCLAALGLNGYPVSLASFRSGGTTFLFREESNIAKLQFHGRWKSTGTMFHYVQTAMATIGMASVPPSATAGVRFAADQFEHLTSWAVPSPLLAAPCFRRSSR